GGGAPGGRVRRGRRGRGGEGRHDGAPRPARGRGRAGHVAPARGDGARARAPAWVRGRTPGARGGGLGAHVERVRGAVRAGVEAQRVRGCEPGGGTMTVQLSEVKLGVGVAALGHDEQLARTLESVDAVLGEARVTPVARILVASDLSTRAE